MRLFAEAPALTRVVRSAPVVVRPLTAVQPPMALLLSVFIPENFCLQFLLYLII